MNAYIVVGPTKDQPRFFRSFDNATDSAEVTKVDTSATVGATGRRGGSKPQM